VRSNYLKFPILGELKEGVSPILPSGTSTGFSGQPPPFISLYFFFSFYFPMQNQAVFFDGTYSVKPVSLMIKIRSPLDFLGDSLSTFTL